MKISNVILAVVFAAIVTSCATSPLGRKQLILLPASQMADLGRASYVDLKKKQPVERDAHNNRYVRCVADALTAELSGKWAEQDWEVTVFKDDSPNAFALPGGKIGVHTGLFKAAKNQHQLAAVMGHEVGHVMARHGNERVSTNLAAQTGLQLATVLAGGASSQKQQVMGLLGVGVQVGVLLPFSRRHESEADLIGLELMASAGFDPRASVELWQNMQKLGGEKPPAFLSTHPTGERRIHDLNRAMEASLAIYGKARSAGKRPRCH
ncbi:MAG TPA: peptidase [Gammaproteobacteria bacterium]|jgi:predicted Zn-dependent protease|nr:peptidase [Gammaproteobacteria bacterium]